jgi:hypothetical protein
MCVTAAHQLRKRTCMSSSKLARQRLLLLMQGYEIIANLSGYWCTRIKHMLPMEKVILKSDLRELDYFE